MITWKAFPMQLKEVAQYCTIMMIQLSLCLWINLLKKQIESELRFPLRLRGGANLEDVPKHIKGFKSNFNLVNSCFFCCVRSLAQRSLNPSTPRKSISPIEILSQLDQYKSLLDFDWTKQLDFKEMLTRSLRLFSMYMKISI